MEMGISFLKWSAIFVSAVVTFSNNGSAFHDGNSSCVLQNTEPGCRRNGIRVAIINLATEKAHWSATHVQSLNLFYARRHSYDYISMSCPPDIVQPHVWDSFDQVRANWAKPTIILQQLEKYHYVVMLDSDAYFADPSITIEEFAEK